MAVVKMNKFSAVGLDTAEEALIADLMDLGCTELNSQDSKLADEEWSALVTKGGMDPEVAELESKLSTVENAIKILDGYDTEKKPLFKTRKRITEKEFDSVLAGRSAIEAEVSKVLELNNKLKDIKGNQNKIETAVLGLRPWTSYPLPVDVQETKYTDVAMGIVSAATDVDQFRSSLEAVTGYSELALVGSDEEQKYLSLIYLKEAEDVVSDVMKQYGFNKIYFKDLIGTAEESIAIYETELSNIAREIEGVEAQLSEKTSSLQNIEWLHDQLIMEVDRMKARNGLLKTGRAFYVDGWVPAKVEDKLKKVLEKHGCEYTITVPEKDEETPVMLENNSAVYPVEVITEMYSLPNSREVDPTALYSLFYICFFGMMFADVGYGLILAALTFFAIKKYGVYEGTAYKLLKSLTYCGISTAIWGALFGGFLGDAINVIYLKFFAAPGAESLHIPALLDPLWFSPQEEPMTLLIFSCILGVVHLFLGMGIKAYEQLRDGDILGAINDNIAWYFLLIGIALLLFKGSLPVDESMQATLGTAGKYMAIFGAALILILPVIMNKGIAKAVGLWNLYGMTSYLADILSYSRLLALGLASAVIAKVFNQLGTMIGGPFIVQLIMFIVIFLVGHVFNLAINGLGSYVHSSRLQYVEFFGKFYEGGGIPFNPFNKKTKYVNIVKEEN